MTSNLCKESVGLASTLENCKFGFYQTPYRLFQAAKATQDSDFEFRASLRVRNIKGQDAECYPKPTHSLSPMSPTL